jgi:hypothetical protein
MGNTSWEHIRECITGRSGPPGFSFDPAVMSPAFDIIVYFGFVPQIAQSMIAQTLVCNRPRRVSFDQPTGAAAHQ